MKRKVIEALILLLTLCLSAAALAESSVVSCYTLDASEVTMNTASNTLAVRKSGSSTYVLMNAEGRELTSKGYILMDPKDTFFEVAVESGLNVRGLIDSEGNEAMPMSYGDVEVFSDRWTMGVMLESATVDNYDYKSWSGDEFYLVSAYDFYYRGAKVGSLGRTEYSYAEPHGNFLYVKDKEGNYGYYDSAFVKSAYTGDGSSSEYAENSSDHTFWHRGSNQQAFAPGCTLTPDDVEVSICCINNQFFDLQGNLLFSAASPYDSVRNPKGGYMLVKAYGKYGLIDETGREVVPCLYDEISCYDAYFGAGYQIAVKDGKVGYVDLNGNETTEFKYTASAAHSYYSPFTDLEDLEGNLIVISAAVGQLPETYAEIGYSRNKDGCPVLVVATDEDHVGVIDLYGNMIIPADGAFDDTYDLTLSNDGALVVGYTVDRQYNVYRLEHTVPPEAHDAAIDEGGETEAAQVSAAESESWLCPNCDTRNAGNFCTECGTAGPEETVSCPSCGHVFEDGVLSKFCPECGTKLGE